MDSAQLIANLLTSAHRLGNHHQKYIQAITRYGAQLQALINDQGWDETIQLTRLSHQPYRELQLISQASAQCKERESLLACYYAFQIIALNLKAINLLPLRYQSTANVYEVYRQFLQQTGNDFRRLTAAYMHILLDSYLPAADCPPFVICGVGTRVDQDDIDLGIIDSGEKDRAVLTSAFGKLNTAMLRSASTLHFHLSEHVGTGGYSASVEDYHQLLDNRIGDCVILSEMLNAVPILGRLELFTQFKNEILQRYFYYPGTENRYHEGFLRGILGEVRDLLYRRPTDYWLNPKRDALRMIKALLFTFKTWKHIDYPTSLEVLHALRQTPSRHQPQFEQLFQTLTFFETFRFLYQLFNVQEEEINLRSPGMTDQLQQVAVYMGYKDEHLAPANQQLLFDYSNHRQLACQATAELLASVHKHLRQISSFHFKNFSSKPKRAGNLAMQFIQQARFFEGVRFWDDVLTQLFNPNKVLLRRFVRDFLRLPPYRRQIVQRTYLRWGFYAPNALMTLLTRMALAQPNMRQHPFLLTFFQEFIHQFPTSKENIDRFFQILNFAPGLINDFLALLPPPLLNDFLHIIKKTEAVAEDKANQQILLYLGHLYLNVSYYFRRYIYRTLQANPLCIKELTHSENLNQLALGLFQNLEENENPESKLDQLTTYYHFQFLTLGLELLDGADLSRINERFTEVSDCYLRLLFETCSATLPELAANISLMQRVTLLVAGGHARQQAFDDDYDLLVLVASSNPQEIELVEKLMHRVNRQILRCGILPHYRFADHFGRYVTPFDSLANYLTQPHPTRFIEQSLLIGARLIVGTTKTERYFQEHILKPFIFDIKAAFITDLIQEISSRRSYYQKAPLWNIKESPGGLRDVENCLFCLKAHYELTGPIAPTFIELLQRQMPDATSDISHLWQNYLFLKHTRDLYRLLVGTDDQLDTERLSQLVAILNKNYQPPLSSGAELSAKLQTLSRENIIHINRLLSDIGYQLE